MKILPGWVVLVVLFSVPALTTRLRAGSIETVAGTVQPANNGDAGAALKINVGQPFGVETGPDGALYICEVQNHRVLRLDLKTGALKTVAGSGKKGYAGDGGPA